MKKSFLVVLLAVFATFVMGVQTVSITSIVEHPALDAVRAGVLEVLESEGFEIGKDVEINYQNAQGSMATATAIAKQFASSKSDVIVAIATPVAQACANATKDIPIVFSAVTDPVGAGLVESFGTNSGNITGISDMTPVMTQMKLAKLILPDIKKLGVIYNPSEANSVTITRFAEDAGKQLGIEIIEITGSTTSEMITSMNAMTGDVDALYIGTDNTAASSIESISAIAARNEVPLFAGDIIVAKEGGLVGFGFNYHQIGIETGKMVVAILKGEDVTSLPTKTLDADSLILYVDADVASTLGIDLPQNIVDRADILVENGVETER